MRKLTTEEIDEKSQALRVVKEQALSLENANVVLDRGIDYLHEMNQKDSEILSILIEEADLMEGEENVGRVNVFNNNEIQCVEKKLLSNLEQIKDMDIIDDTENWDKYMSNVHAYAKRHNLNLDVDQMEYFFTEKEKHSFSEMIRKDYLVNEPNCDAFDYSIAAFWGFAGGVIDIFFTGAPGDSKIQAATDLFVDKAVIKFAEMVCKDFKSESIENVDDEKRNKIVAKAINKLGNKFTASYDATSISEFDFNNMTDEELKRIMELLPVSVRNKIFGSSDGYLECTDRAKIISAAKQALGTLNSKNHHIKSLSHSQDIIGLFFSILDQWTKSGTYIFNGNVVRVRRVYTGSKRLNEPREYAELEGTNLIAKICCGAFNWLVHCMSDIAGSGNRKDGGRGMGLPMPFFELSQFLNIKVPDFLKDEKKGDDKVITWANFFDKYIYREGYDARFALAQRIPLAVTEVMTRLSWAMKQWLWHGKDIKDIIPVMQGDKPELRRMLTISFSTLCGTDAVGAVVVGVQKSGGDLRIGVIQTVLHMNYMAWKRLAIQVVIEVRYSANVGKVDFKAIEQKTNDEWKMIFKELRVV